MNKMDLVSRVKAAAVHFIFSFVVLSSFLLGAFWLWYWPTVYQATGFVDVVWLVVVVDLCAGPLATFIVWRQGKKGLLLDMVVIALVQLAFLGYGVYSIAASRPVFYVFVIDDFELVSAASVVWPDQPVDYRVSLFDEARFVGASFSKDPVVRERQRNAELFDGLSLARRPEAYEAIESRAEDLLEKARSLDDLKKHNPEEKVLAVLGQWPDAYGYLPLKGPVEDLTVLIDKQGHVLGLVSLVPW